MKDFLKEKKTILISKKTSFKKFSQEISHLRFYHDISLFKVHQALLSKNSSGFQKNPEGSCGSQFSLKVKGSESKDLNYSKSTYSTTFLQSFSHGSTPIILIMFSLLFHLRLIFDTSSPHSSQIFICPLKNSNIRPNSLNLNSSKIRKFIQHKTNKILCARNFRFINFLLIIFS